MSVPHQFDQTLIRAGVDETTAMKVSGLETHSMLLGYNIGTEREAADVLLHSLDLVPHDVTGDAEYPPADLSLARIVGFQPVERPKEAL